MLSENIIVEKKHNDLEDIGLMVNEICREHGIYIQSAKESTHLNDFKYRKEDEEKLIYVLNNYLKDHKVK